VTEITIQPPLDVEAAQKLGQDIDQLLKLINGHELRLSASYARLGGLLREVKIHAYWQAFGYDRFSSYLEDVREKINRQRSQVYAILSVAESLLPHLSEEQLETIGISKAHELRRLVKNGGTVQARILDPEGKELYPTDIRIMDYAARENVTALKLRAAVNNILHVKEGPQGNWFDLGGFYALPDEKKEIEQFWELGRKVLEIGAEESEHEIKKQVMLAAARECAGQWSAEVSDGR